MNIPSSHENQKHGDKAVTIIVNGRPKHFVGEEVSFAQIVALAFDKPPSGGSTIFTVTYKRGPAHKPEGTMVEGGVVKVKEGMVFNVTRTHRS